MTKIKLIVLALSTVAVIGVGYFTIQWLQDSGKQEIQIEQLETEIQTRKKIDDAVRTAPRDVNDADKLLREFLGTNN